MAGFSRIARPVSTELGGRLRPNCPADLLRIAHLTGELTLTELASKYDVHPTMIASWKRQVKEGMVASFSGKAATVKKDSKAEIRELHAKIGQLTVEKDFLERAFAKR